MGLTYAQAKALGIGHLHPSEAGPPATAAPAVASAPPGDGMTKLERSFRDDVLEAALAARVITRWRREPLTFRLAGRCRYTPDFLVDTGMLHPALHCVECKAYLREDAAIKIKVAAGLYPEFHWLLVYRDGRRGWRVHRVTDRGIDVNPVGIPWIHGG